ncbi:MAG TPA: 50S ribosomal protein L5 [Candidatus Saccharimonadales bacterium]|nr:50S ribosomal protein L5 [Candidatus Saccharimonadales bacterium]
MTSYMQDKYQKEVAKKLQEALKIKNPMALPKITKIVVNMGVQHAIQDKKNMEVGTQIMEMITGQKPKVTAAKKSIASFKLREGDKIGLVVTLRGDRMYDFFGKLVDVVLPRIKDFRGISNKSFDTRGNYTLGLSEYTVFPEIDPGKVDRVQGLQVTITTNAKNTEEALALLKEMGMPFIKLK